MNCNWYDDKQYDLKAVHVTSEEAGYRFSIKLYGQTLLSHRVYANEKSAISAPRRWIKNYIHDYMP